MKIKVKASPSETENRTFLIEVDKDDWDKMDDEERRNVLQSELDGLPDQPYWHCSTYSVFDQVKVKI